MLFDGFLSSFWTPILYTSIGLFIPRTIVLVIIILTFYYPRKFMYGIVALIGFIMDAYYLGFIGIYMAVFILAVAFVSTIEGRIRPNVVSYTLSSILVLTVSEIIIYGIMRILGVTSMTFQIFIVSRLSATLLFNGLIILIFSFFVDRLIISLMDEAKVR